MRRVVNVRWGLRGLVGLAAMVAAQCAGAETLSDALAKAYLNNPDINQQRAGVRAADEGVPKARAGYFPTASAEADVGFTRLQTNVTNVNTQPRGVGLTVQQTLWNGNRTENGV